MQKHRLTAVSAPHNFLKIDERWQEKVNTREWIMARIVTTDEAVAGDVSNPIDIRLTDRHLLPIPTV